MSKILFAGPSIYGLGLESSADLTILPPAGCGDVLRAVRAGARSIGIVDGLFSTEPSIWHKEILLALSKGIRVLGASSLGALRAAECDHFGMEGVGRIYADYRDGRRTEDSDVALLHGPAEMRYCPLTVPLVDAQATIEALSARKSIGPEAAQALFAASSRLHFAERTWTTIVANSGIAADDARRIATTIEASKVEQKKRDAVQLIRQLEVGAPASPDGPTWTLNRTYFLTVLEERIA
jgi:hypothetical protein